MNDFSVWVEKYRPMTFGDIVGNPLVLNKIKQNTGMKNITNLLLYGPPGNGKTSCAYVIARAIFGNDNLMGNFKEINASDQENRGIDVVTQKIKPFASTLPLFSNAPFRILLLDEADQLTPEAQAALRRTIEKHNRNCRFVLTVNNVEAIIPAIRSRCTEYEFRPIDKEIMIQHLQHISMLEDLSLTDKQFDSIAERSYGDVRVSINLLQNLKVNVDDYQGVFARNVT